MNALEAIAIGIKAEVRFRPVGIAVDFWIATALEASEACFWVYDAASNTREIFQISPVLLVHPEWEVVSLNALVAEYRAEDGDTPW